VTDLDSMTKRLAGLSPAKRALLEKRLRGEPSASSRPAIPRRPLGSSAPLSYAQERIWFVDQLLPGSAAAHNIPVAFFLDGDLDVKALEKAFVEIVKRHEALRTVFADTQGQPRQVILDRSEIPIEYLDLQDLAESRREQEALGLASEAAYRSFNLAAGPLARAGLFRLWPTRHLMTVTFHHIISDEWSVGIFVRELASLYHAYCTGQPSPLSDLPIQFADYACWERSRLSGEALDAKVNYWLGEVEGATDLLDLHADFRLSDIQTSRGSSQLFELSEGISARLKVLAHQHGASLFMLLVAALQAFVFRLTNRREFVINCAIANRPGSATERLIGCFINTLLVRSDVSSGLGFEDLLERVRDRVIRSFSYQDAPFEKVVERLKLKRDLSNQPFSQLMLVLLEDPESIPNVSGLDIRLSPLETTATPYDLMLHFWERERKIAGILRYSTELFKADTARRFLERLQYLLEAVAENPERRLSELPRSAPSERHQILGEWNATSSEFPDRLCLHELFEEQSERNPDVIAVFDGHQEWSYRELNERANQLAQHLRSLGVGPESIVGLSVRPSVDMITAILGILKAGGVFAPLDPTYPKYRLSSMIAKARLNVLVTEELLAERFELCDTGVVRLDADSDRISRFSRARPKCNVCSDNLCYVVFTSGSTGTPKAIAITHKGVVNNMIDVNSRLSIGATDRLLAVSSLSFDMSVHEILGTLAAGACIVLPAGDAFREPGKWAGLMASRWVSIWSSAPALLEMLLNTAGNTELAWVRNLRLALLAGDWIPLALPGRLREMAPDVLVVSLGGAAEASVYTVAYPIQEVQDHWKSIPYGRAMTNQRVYIIGSDLDLTPIGVPGELCLGGIGLGRGYFNSSAQTAEKFIPNPFATQSGERVYRTGDLARWEPDGNLQLLGRIDQQVKIRGMRVDLTEIEATLKQHPTIADAVVVVRESAKVGKRLIAYYIPAAEVSVVEIKEHLRHKLPTHMRPAYLVSVESFPLLPSGKVNRTALPEPEERCIGPGTDCAEPRTALETVLIGIWREVLCIDEIGIHDDFFDLGGHSLLAAQVIARLKDIFQTELPLRTLFESPTVARLGEQVETLELPVQTRVRRIAEIVLAVEQMSDEEVRHRVPAIQGNASAAAE
jgi:amino acid adenylation domain-containing protein